MSCHVDKDVPTRIIGDPNRIGQVLNNLISNALKFTAQGSINVSLAVESRADAGGETARWLRFSVQDTGIGIPPEKREAIFEAFVQGDLSKSKRYAGTGIGLTICRSLV